VKAVLWTWTALCAAVVSFALFTAPTWDTDAEGYKFFSGADEFPDQLRVRALARIVPHASQSTNRAMCIRSRPPL